MPTIKKCKNREFGLKREDLSDISLHHHYAKAKQNAKHQVLTKYKN